MQHSTDSSVVFNRLSSELELCAVQSADNGQLWTKEWCGSKQQYACHMQESRL